MVKRTLLTLSITAISATVIAQNNWSIGFRTGGEPYKTQKLNKDSKGILLHEQLFLTKRIHKNIELELNTAYKATVNNSTVDGPIDDGPRYILYSQSIKTLEAGLSLRYFIYQNNGWAPYVIVSSYATIQYNSYSSKSDGYYGWGGYYPPQDASGKAHQTNYLDNIGLGVGINKEISNHWKLNSQLIVSYYDYQLYYNYSNGPTFSPRLQLGLAYTF